jgi:hypothetical protein
MAVEASLKLAGPMVRPRADTAGRSEVSYIVGAVYDWVFFLLPPMIGLTIGIMISGTALTDSAFRLWDQEVTWAGLGIGVFIHAHLVIVFFRSHGNAEILRLHPFRFIWVPPLLYLALVSSAWLLVSAAVLVTFWDVYHSGAQTFGLARIYDRRAGNDSAVGRRLDWWLNQMLYAGPILAGATMIDHFDDFEQFDNVGGTFFTAIPAFMVGHQRYFTWAVLGAGTLYVLYYIGAYIRLSRQGYRVSPLKIFLLATTGFCSIYAWGFNTWGEAFFIMNFFHALQYFGIVWAFEQKRLVRLFRVENRRFGQPIAASAFVVLGFGYGLWVQSMDSAVQWLWAITLVVSILHFWYDGFIWSVRKKQV